MCYGTKARSKFSRLQLFIVLWHMLQLEMPEMMLNHSMVGWSHDAMSSRWRHPSLLKLLKVDNSMWSTLLIHQIKLLKVSSIFLSVNIVIIVTSAPELMLSIMDPMEVVFSKDIMCWITIVND